MSDLKEKIKTSVDRIQRFSPITDYYSDKGEKGYYLAFSGGKDSVVVKRLMDMAGVKYDAHYRITSVDPPELYRFIKNQHPDVQMDYPRDKYGEVVTMWNLIPQKMMPPTRKVRYCCEYLKETGGNDRFVVTGVRWAESVNRKKNQGIITAPDGGIEGEGFVETDRGGTILVNDNTDARSEIEECPTLHKLLLNPIVDWTDADVWEFIRAEKIPYCELYDEGFARLGCIGCPMAKQHGREREFFRWPKYRAAYLKSFDKMLQERWRRGKLDSSWRMGTTAQDVFRWWMEYDTLPGQIDWFEDEY